MLLERSGETLAIDHFAKIDRLSASDFKRVVLRTVHFANTIRSTQTCKLFRSSSFQILESERSTTSRADWFSLSDNFLITCMGYGQIAGVDLKTGECIGKYSPPAHTYVHYRTWVGTLCYLVYVMYDRAEEK